MRCGDVAALELALINGIVRDEYRDKLAPLTWEDAGERVWVPVWREQARANADRLVGITPTMLPTLAQDRGGLAVRLRLVRDRGAADDAVMRESAHALGTAMAVALHARGFAVRAMPGHSVRLERGDVSIAPFSALGDLASGEMTTEAWRDQCDRAGITNLDLGNRE